MSDPLEDVIDAVAEGAKRTSRFWSTFGNFGKLVLGLVGLGLFGLLLFRMFFLTSTENYHMVYIYDRLHGGKITVVGHQGYIYAEPFVKSVNVVDTRPFQVCLTSNKRVMNCKLVNFNPASEEGLREFLGMHGRDDYDINDESEGGFRDIMKSYAFDQSGKQYPFLIVGSVTDTAPKAADAAGR